MSSSGVHPALTALYAKRPGVIKPGLARIEAALQVLGADALLARPSVLIGGTNGKGTTAGFLWQLLAARGERIGLFTSPHLVDFAERVQVSGIAVTDALLLEELAALKAELPADVYEPLSFFEVNTLLALRLFRRLGTKLDVLEVGLGGRWDSTNVARPKVSIITSIGLDHTEMLGDTPAKIAFEKAGIMRPRTPVIWGGAGAGDASAIQVLKAEAATREAPFLELGVDFGEVAPLPAAWGRWPGFLRDNWLKAVAAYQQLGHGTKDLEHAVGMIDRGEVPVPPSLCGRFQQASARGPDGRSRRVLLDVCHNVDGARALVRGLKETGLLMNGPLPALISILTDKRCDEILDVLRPALAPMQLFPVTSERSWSPERLAQRHRDLPFYPSLNEALRAALISVPPAGGPLIICGSVHAVGEVMSALGMAPLK